MPLFGRRVPFMPQLELADCGPACVGMVLGFHGRRVGLEEIRRRCATGRDGISAATLARCAESYGMKVRGIKCDVAALARLRTPAILHWDFSHFVVLEQVRGRRFVLSDPGVGRRVADAEEMSRAFTGVGLELRRSPDFVTGGKVGARWKLRPWLRPYGVAMLVLLGTAIALQLLALVTPTLEQVMVDHVVLQGRASWVLPVAVALLTTMLMTPVLQACEGHVLARARFAASLRHTAAFVARMLALPSAFLLRRSAGELATRVRSLESLQTLTSELIERALHVLLVASAVVVLMAYNVGIGGLVLVHALLRLVLMLRAESRSQHHQASELMFASKERGVCAEAFAAIETLHGLHAQAHAVDRHGRSLTRRLNASLQHRSRTQLTASLLRVGDDLARAAMLFVGARSVIANEMTLGGLVAVIAVSRFLEGPLTSVCALAADWARFKTIRPGIDDVLEQPLAPWGEQEHGLSGAVELQQVSYCHEGASRPALQDISLRLAPGEHIAIVGHSGSGKSSLGRILAGATDASSGTVRYDGVALRAFRESCVRRQVVLVSQDVFVASGTVHDNLCLAELSPTHEECVRTLHLADAGGFVANLPGGLSGSVGTAGAALSGGERQRLALARALMLRPSLLILDEATSCLDPASEERVWRGLSRLRATVVSITHRLETLRYADRVLVLSGGRLVQVGSMAELAASPGPFRELFGRSLSAERHDLVH